VAKGGIWVLFLSAWLTACAVNPLSAGKVGPDDAVMLGGYDAVSYFSGGAPVRGQRALSASYQGVQYHFATAANQDEFRRNPQRYAPQYGGFCSNGMVYAVKTPGSPQIYRVINDRLYLFGGARSRDYFEMDLARNLVYANRYWEVEAKDAAPGVQNLRRWVFQVPHYRSDADLHEELSRRKGGEVKS
jgi:YHS domain-containing protein